MSELIDRWNAVKQRISKCAVAANRKVDDVSLLAVSKTRPAEMIRELAGAGQVEFGENYVQEAVDKIQSLQDLDLIWHFIGPLQSNKTRLVADNFDWVHSVDRIKIAQRLNEQRPAGKPPLNVLIQVNISDESSKSGVQVSDLDALAQVIMDAPALVLKGLMAIPVAETDPVLQRTVFARLRQIRDALTLKLGIPLPILSMGMSGDMEAAIEEGASYVRIGTDIFGPRDYSQTSR